ncbi:hypothetical protein L1047_00800 [Synechococcus sp. Nb3U1]|uniref:hypothetical protein n=1 Tax=Synechococcus sp. Nb3U1 TaxID=1914529 RepID=UPI001F25CD59|nr:hypothetical protein [Synechococcus sp. Nb3U1]MCF2969735.1 hypothetical protein [Synechococcus sp. Nb3U1]
MLRPSFLFSGSALLGMLSLLLMGGECSWVAWRQRSLTQVPLQALAESAGPSDGAFWLFEDEPDPTPLLTHQAQLQERVQELEQRSQSHQQQAHQLLSHPRRGIPHQTPIAARSNPTLTSSARPRRQDPTLSQAASQPAAPNYLARLTRQIEQEPGNARLYLQRAQHFWHQSQEDPFAVPQPEQASAIAHLMRSALRDLNIAIALDPYLSEAYLLKAKIQYERLREPEQALVTLSPLDRFAYRNPQLHLMRSRIWAEQGHLESAFDVSHLAIELAQQSQNKADLFEAYVHRGLMWGSVCDLSLAMQDFSRAIDLLPHRGDPYYYRGIAGAYLGSEPRCAAADLGSALMLWRASGTGSPARLEHAEAVRMELLQQLRQ